MAAGPALSALHFTKAFNHALPFCPYVYWKYLRKFDSTFFFFFFHIKLRAKGSASKDVPVVQADFPRTRGHVCSFYFLGWVN